MDWLRQFRVWSYTRPSSMMLGNVIPSARSHPRSTSRLKNIRSETLMSRRSQGRVISQKESKARIVAGLGSVTSEVWVLTR